MFILTRLLKSRYPLRVQIAALFSVLIITTGVVIIIFNHHQITKLTEINTSQQYQKIALAIATELDTIIRPIVISTNLLASIPAVEQYNLEKQRTISLQRMFIILEDNHYASAAYRGYPNGDFFLLRRLTSINRPTINAPEDAAWLIQNIEHHNGIQKKFIFLNADKQIIQTLTPTDYNYEPRNRDWYTSAQATEGLVTSSIYTFQLTQEAGITFSQKLSHQDIVVGIDLSLTSLAQFMHRQQLPVGSKAIIISAQDDVIASLDPQDIIKNTDRTQSGLSRLRINNPVFAALMQHADFSTLNDNFRLTDHASISTLFEVKQSNGERQRWYGSLITVNHHDEYYRLAIATPYNNLTADINVIDNQSKSVTLGLLFLSLPIVWFFSLKISHPLIKLRMDADAISNFYFDDRVGIPSAVVEIDDLNQSMTKMKMTIKNFISITRMLSPGQDFIVQMQGLLKETIDIATMSGGVVFLSDCKEGKIFTLLSLQWNNEQLPVSAATPLQNDEITFLNFSDLLQGKTVSGYLDAHNIPVQLHVFLHTHLPLKYIAVPMTSQEKYILGFMLLFSLEQMAIEKEQTKIELVNALVGGLSVSVETQRLLQEQKSLLNAFVELIAGAIDAKSEYTGGHCQRVPEITKMLAQAAVDVKEGPFASFTMTAAEWEELHIASWLHDCGKITTPEFIVDKATKLEMIYDRIHEIRMRFEVLKREEEIAFLKQKAMPVDDDPGWAVLNARLKQLDEDFYFIAQSNLGTEFLNDDTIARIQQIANYQWTRTLDDRAGIAHVELARISHIAPATLPVKENMLADKQEHIIMRGKRDKLPESLGFKIKEPRFLYNHGEIYNLGIRRGTLTAEDRYKVNEHIMQTIIMLKRLPFPYTMTHVPEIAGGHHERVDGQGYPYQLTRDQMSIQVRIMAIADVFEALTAVDRPYKTGKFLSESLSIMVNMVNNHHLDAQLFILFLESAVWEDYAKKYLPPQLVDPIDIPALLKQITV